MARVVHFEIYADNPERAVKFYTDVFGWQIKKWDGPVDYWLATTGPDDEPGINGAIMRRSGESAASKVNTYVCTIGVDDIDAIIAKLDTYRLEIALPKDRIPGVGWQAYYRDTEGNLFGIHQADPGA